MGYNQNNAGMHYVQYPSQRGFEINNTYSEMMEDAQIKKCENFIKDVELCNFVTISYIKGARKKCLCGGALHYYDFIPVKYHKGNKLETFNMVGKVCTECGRKFLIKQYLIDKMYEEMKNGRDS